MSYDPYTPPENNPYQQQPAQPVQPPKTSGFAITYMVLGILGVCTACCWIGGIIGIPAVMFGHLAQGESKKSNGQVAGGGMALAGLICGYLAIAWFFVLILITIFGNTAPTYNYDFD